jgi:peptidoglycan/xylan/chitin deacetylase (PgdA/CDA1 family)
MEITRSAFVAGATAALVSPEASFATTRTEPISSLPKSSQRRFAWTIDDGFSSASVKAHLDIAEFHNQHLTLFVTSAYDSWRIHSKQITRLLDAGKIQLGNHTVNHKDLTTSSSAEVRRQLKGCHDFLLSEFGYDARPYFRPTYGSWNKELLRIAAELGYTAPITWYGTFGDASSISEAQVVKNANHWIANGRIIISHANRFRSQETFHQILNTIKTRDLASVTLREAFGPNFK